MKTPRDYQENAIKALFDYLFTKQGSPLVVAPVGSGKSLIMAEFMRRVQKDYPRTKIVCLAHVKELLVQNANELYEQWPEADYGFYCAGLKQKELFHDITFASIQSVSKKALEFDRAPEIILIDEAHLISHKKETTYRRFLEECRALNPNVKIIGLTGTPFRADAGRLDIGEDKMFDDIAYEIPIDYMINEGYWCQPVTPDVKTKMDVSGVDIRGGDYVAGQLERAINVEGVTSGCINEILEYTRDRKKVLIFTAGIQHCQSVLDGLHAAGQSAAMLTGKTPAREREAILREYKEGKFKFLVNVAVLTTGFNEPAIDCLVFMRPTRSPVLYIQCVGRGVRTTYAKDHDLSTKEGRINAIAASDKKDCLILDFGDVIEELGPIDDVSMANIREKNKKDRAEAEVKERNIMKQCPECEAYAQPAQNYCYECSYSFIDEKLRKEAEEKAIISAQMEPFWVDVAFMGTYKHQKKSDPTATPSLRVTYGNFNEQYSEYICFEHTGYARDKAIKWHEERSYEEIPSTIDEAAEIEYKRPTQVLVKKDGKYWRIVDYKFDDVEEIPFDEL